MEPDFKAGVFRLFAKDMGLGDPPIQLRLLAGEISYQLRSALDHLADIFAVQTSEWSREFPIFDSRAGYETKGLSQDKGNVRLSRERRRRESNLINEGGWRSCPLHPSWMLHSINIVDNIEHSSCATYPSDLRVKV